MGLYLSIQRQEPVNPNPFINRFPFAHTFSIVARDPSTGQMGVAVQSHWFSVGSIVAWGEAGVGVVATQAMAQVGYGPLGLRGMRRGKSAHEVLAGLLAADDGRDLRQVAMLDATGCVAVHTGSRCIAHAGHKTGDACSVQANMMVNDRVWPAMLDAFEQSTQDLPERLLAALEAAQQAGGDVRGQQSAALLVVEGTSTGKPWEGRLFDLRVEDAPQPIAELRRLVGVQRAYQAMNRGDEYLGLGEVEKALQAYRTAAEMQPDMDELPFWHAVTLADLGRLDEALVIFRQVFSINPNWADLVQRLPAAGLMKDDPGTMRRILEVR